MGIPVPRVKLRNCEVKRMRSRVRTVGLRLFIAFALLLTALASNAFAQTATLTGRVTDSTGAVIPGVSVAATNLATSVERVTRTNEVGYYAIPLLPPGSYRISVTQDGFKSVSRAGVILEVDQKAAIDFQMEVGEVAERIEVTADAVQLNTVEASRGQVIENRRIVDMPLNGRDYIQLALLSAGTVQPIGGRYGGFSTAGQKTTQNNFMLDGIDNNGIELAGAQRRGEMIKPSIDAVQEFKVQTNAYAAEFGRAMGGVVNVTTKSGTNQFHGAAFWFLRNEELDAKNFFDPADRDKPPFKRNQFGFAAGGPIIPNKLFIFGDYEGTRIRESATITSTVPSQAMRQGDFSGLGQPLNDPTTGAPFAGNIIPENRFDRLGSDLINLYPAPQNNNAANNFVNQSPDKEDQDRWDVRSDWNIGSKDTVFGRISWNDREFPAALALPPPAFGGGFDGTVTGWNIGGSWNHIWSPNLIMNIRGGWNFAEFTRVNPAAAGSANLNEQFDVPGVDRTQPGGFSNFGVSGFRNVGLGGFNPVDRDSQNRQIAGDATWIKGAHTIKFGANVLRSQNNIFNIRNEVGNFNFNGRFTGNGAADLLVGATNQLVWSNRLLVQLRSWNTGYFIQDDWKITPRLTLNLGARYELVLPFQEKNDKMGNFLIEDPNNVQLVLAGTPAAGDGRRARSLIKTDPNNIMPRVGFAYRVTEKTVIRGGFGMFYGYLEPTGDSEFLIGNAPFAFGVTQTSSPTAPVFQLSDGPAPGSLELANATGLTFASFEQDPDNFYNAQWNFNIQHQLGQDWLVEVGYSGSKASHLLERFEGNFSPPGPGNLNAKRPIQSAEIPGVGIVSPLGPVQFHQQAFNSNYQALVAKLEKRFSQGFTVLTSYTFSKTMGDTACGGAAPGNAGGCGIQDPTNRRNERARDSQDFPHAFVLSGVWEVPFGRGRAFGSNWNSITDTILGGWSLGSIVSYASGAPFSPVVQGNPANTGSITVVNRPNVVGDPDAGDRTVNRDFNTDAFVANNQFGLGNAGRNILRGRNQFNWDFSALKDFPIKERMKLQFRFEAFHFTNTPRFGNPGNVLGTPNFGVIGSAETPRNLQFGLKLLW